MSKPFRFGLQSYTAPTPQSWRDQARKAEDLGFGTFSVADHILGPIGLIRALLGPGEVDLVGEHVHAVGFEGVPKPHDGVPPIMIGGGSPRVLGIAGREADIVSLNFNNSAGKFGPDLFSTGAAALTTEKIGWIRDGAGDRFDDIEIEIAGYFTVLTDQRETTLEQMAPIFGVGPEQLAELPHALIGSVDSICDQIVERRERYGISYVTFGHSVIDDVAPIVERLAGK